MRNPAKTPAPDAEEWRDVPGFEGYYQASSWGRVRSVPRVLPPVRGFSSFPRRLPSNIRTPQDGGHGRLYIMLSRGNRMAGKNFYLPELILITFGRPQADPDTVVGFLDGDFKNLRPENLDWVPRPAGHMGRT